MNALGFKPDTKISDVLRGQFTLSAEVIPPRNGSEQLQVLGQIEKLIRAGAQFLSVTKGAGGSLRGGSLPIAQAIKERFGVPCIAHFTCRDLTPQEVENQLMDHHLFGIRNILALRGDPPADQAQWNPRDGSYSYAYRLVEQIKDLNQGKFLGRPEDVELKPTQHGTDFCIGAAVYPEHPNPKERIEFFKKKIDAGAEYAITQMVFDVDSYSRFRDACDREGLRIPILPGTRILKTRDIAQKMESRFQVKVSNKLLQTLPADPSESQALDANFAFLQELRRAGAPGIHLFVLSDTMLVCQTLDRLRK